MTMIDVDKVREEIQGVINEFGMDYYKSNYFELTSQALKELERLQKKEIPMNPVATLDVKGKLDFICPYCNRRVIVTYDKYCCNCGQKLSWEGK